MKAQPIWASDYTGERWRYAMTLRPFSTFNLPNDYVDHLLMQTPDERLHPDYRHGTVSYSVKLPDSVAEHFDLVLLTA